VFVYYTSNKGVAFIEGVLDFSREWTEDPGRREEAGVPGEIFAENKIEQAQVMLKLACAAEVPARWVVVDSFYGMPHEFRERLEELERPYAVMVPKTNAVLLGGCKEKIEQLVQRRGDGP
jgi:SRSO17 transposase